MLLIIQPVTFISLAVRPSEDAVASLLAVLELALVAAAILKVHDASAIHVIVFPFANILQAVFPPVFSVSLFDILYVVTFIGRSIVVLLESFALEETFLK